MAETISLDRFFLCGGGLLESGRRGNLRFHDQSADRALLHAGPEHDCSPCSRCALRSVRHAGTRPDAVLPARDEAGYRLEAPADMARLLGNQHWDVARDCSEPAARRLAANLSIGIKRILVSA